MAVRHGYGKIAGTDALVFAYDTGDTRNSYKGEPTTNLVPYSEYQYLADGYTQALSGWDTHEGTMLIDVGNKVPGFTNRSIKLTCIQANVYKQHFSVPLTNGQTYTVSFWAKAQVAGNYGNFFLGDGPGGYLIVVPGDTALTTEFTRFEYTFSMTARDTGTYNFATYLYGDGQIGWLSGFQIENKNHVTQYLPSNGAATTRSATQGLLDLTGNSTIDLANVSFDSNAQMFFDGTDDYIDIPNSTTLFSGTQDFTVEAAYNMEGQGGGAILGNYGPGYTTNHLWFSGQYGIWLDGGVYAPGYPLSNGRYNMVGTRESGVMKLYLNGVLVNSGTRSNSIATDINYRIGADVSSPNEEFTGDIYVVKAYSRALTADEVRNNYNQYRTRFNI